ncbi:hypothetical protein AXK61_07610 [Tsukamurella pseudospumae]|uniref:Uncharacterized protein n=1 Tax=Tsukamurella pseudospumae TaxID=239498 RepID=A0A137YX03_9ACTN|nr:hypothetical protein AXK61_07610 [Tsukamurella pseudospumae]
MGNFSAAGAAMDGKFSIWIMVGTSPIPFSTMVSMVSAVSPEPCSIASTPAASRPGRASSPKTCAVTRAPASWATATASASTSSGHSGARSPTDRSIQSPTSLIHGCPSAARRRTAATSWEGSSSCSPRPRVYRLTSAM